MHTIKLVNSKRTILDILLFRNRKKRITGLLNTDFKIKGFDVITCHSNNNKYELVIKPKNETIESYLPIVSGFIRKDKYGEIREFIEYMNDKINK